jgi:UTP-glucose-1-phosphate uridylyltransferase
VFANYDVAKIAGSPVSSIEQTQRMNTIKTFGHRTVWLEMVRQKDALGLGKAFLRNPEALTW